MKKIFILFLLCGCGPQYVDDPNAYTVVTVQYEDGPVRVISPKGEECRPQLDCSNKNEAECAIALYNASEAFIKEGEGLADKNLYLSASVEYMQAMTRLSEAEIRIKRIGAKKITNNLNYCEIYKSHYHNYLNRQKENSSDHNMREEL